MADISIIHEGNTDYNVKDAVGREALAVVENKGAKNDFDLENKIDSAVSYHATTTLSRGVLSVSATGNWARTAVPYLFKKGTSTFSCTVSNYTKAGGTIVIRFAENADSTSPLCDGVTITGNGNVNIDITVNSDTNGYIIYYIDANGTSYANSADFSNNMICTTAEWDISQAYVPYCKTNAELTNDTSTLFTENTRQETEIGVVANAGAKNLLKYRKDVTSLSAGNVYARINSDGTLSVGLTSGTTATAQLVFTLGSITKYRDRKLILSGCPAGGNYQSGYALYVANDGSTAQADIGSGATLPIVTGVTSSVVALIVRNGTTISSELTFRPMVRDASIVDSTFVPGAKTNRELTVLTDEDRASLVELVDGGAKNLLKNTLGSGTKSGLVYTTGTDGSIVITAGTPTANADFVIPFTPTKTGQYVLQGCPSGGSGTTFKGQITLYPSMTNVVEIFDNTSVTATLTGGTQYAYRFRVYSGKAIGDVTIYPMVCSEAAWKISTAYQPYAKSNREATLNIDGVDIAATSDSHADLNDYTDTGLYIVRGSAIAQYIDNCPVSARGFALQVWNLGGSTCVQEIIDPDVSAAAIYIRRKISSGWRPWFKFEGTAVT